MDEQICLNPKCCGNPDLKIEFQNQGRRLRQLVSPPEREILEQLVRRGDSNSAIAFRTRVPTRTVKHRVSNLIDTFGVNNRTQLAIKALRLGVICACELSNDSDRT